MTEQLISFETAKLAHEKGFAWTQSWLYRDEKGELRVKSLKGVEPLRGQYACFNDEGKEIYPKLFNTKNKHIPRPTQALLQRWLRETKGLDVLPCAYGLEPVYHVVIYCTSDITPRELSPKAFIKYEDAMEAGLASALELLD